MTASGRGEIEVYMCDDSSALRTLVRLQLEGATGLRLVGGCGDPAECVKGVGDAQPDVVLLDHGMVTEPDPAAYVQRLRAAAPGARVVLFSGMPQDMLEGQSGRLGTDGHLHKAATGAELAAALAQIAAD